MRIVKDTAYYLRCEAALEEVTRPFPVVIRPDARIVELCAIARRALDSQYVPSTISERISAYLRGGGLFNPELANHTAVRDLLMDCQTEIDRLRRKLDE